MRHAKFQNHRPSGSEEEEDSLAFYSHGGHLSHATLTTYTNFHYNIHLKVVEWEYGPRPLGPIETDGLLVHPVKTYTLWTGHLSTG